MIRNVAVPPAINSECQKLSPMSYMKLCLLSALMMLGYLSAVGQCNTQAGALTHDIYKVCTGGMIKGITTVQPVVPDGYQVIYVLTSGEELTIQNISPVPSFGSIFEAGFYFIHTFVYHPDDFDLSMLEFGLTSALTINAMLEQGGGNVCGSLLLDAPEFKLVNCNFPPTAVDDAAVTNIGTAVTIDVMMNDYDSNGADVHICGNTQPTHGNVSNFMGLFTYTPNAGFVGTDVFSYSLCNESGQMDYGNVVIYVGQLAGGGNEPNNPCSDIGSYCTEASTSVTICPEFCALNSEIVLTNVTAVYSCSVVEDNGCIVYTPLPGFIGDETLSITSCDANGACDTYYAQISIGNCGNINLPPVAVDDSANSDGGPISIVILGNDSDPEGGELSLTNVMPPTFGTFTLTGNTINYTPNEGFVGVETIYYEICDDLGACTMGMVTITVDAPVGPAGGCVTEQYFCTAPVVPLEICVDICDLAPSAAIMDVHTLYECSLGETQTNCFTYTALPGFLGLETITIDVCDAAGNCLESVAYVNVGDCGDGDLIGWQEGAQSHGPVQLETEASIYNVNGELFTDLSAFYEEEAISGETKVALRFFDTLGRLLGEQRGSLDQLRQSTTSFDHASLVNGIVIYSLQFESETKISRAGGTLLLSTGF